MNKTIDLGKDPVKPLFFKYAVPSILGMFGMTVAGIVDGIIVGRFLGADALAAVNITYPLASIAVGISLMMGVGGTTLAASSLGSGKNREAGKILSLTVGSIVVVSTLFTAFFLIFIRQMINILGAAGSVEELVFQYSTALIPFFLPFMLSITLEGFIRVDGRPNFGMFCFLIGVVANIVFDLLFVGVFGWGLTGAAIATGGSQVLAFIPMLFHFILKRGRLRFVRGGLDFKVLGKMVSNGSSELVNNSADGITRLIFNYVLIQSIGTAGVAAYAVLSYFSSFAFVLFIGFGSVLPPVVGYNLGAGKLKRIKSFLNLGLISNGIVGIIAFFVLFFFGGEMVSLFIKGGDSTILNLSENISVLLAPALLFSGINITISIYFTAVHKALKSALLALSGSLVLQVLFLFLLPLFLGESGIWLSVVCAQGITMILSVVTLKNDKLKFQGTVSDSETVSDAGDEKLRLAR